MTEIDSTASPYDYKVCKSLFSLLTLSSRQFHTSFESLVRLSTKLIIKRDFALTTMSRLLVLSSVKGGPYTYNSILCSMLQSVCCNL